MNAVTLEILGCTHSLLWTNWYLNYSPYGGSWNKRVTTCDWQRRCHVRLPGRTIVRAKSWEIRVKLLQWTWTTRKESTVSTPNLFHHRKLNFPVNTKESEVLSRSPISCSIPWENVFLQEKSLLRIFPTALHVLLQTPIFVTCALCSHGICKGDDDLMWGFMSYTGVQHSTDWSTAMPSHFTELAVNEWCPWLYPWVLLLHQHKSFLF